MRTRIFVFSIALLSASIASGQITTITTLPTESRVSGMSADGRVVVGNQGPTPYRWERTSPTGGITTMLQLANTIPPAGSVGSVSADGMTVYGSATLSSNHTEMLVWNPPYTNIPVAYFSSNSCFGGGNPGVDVSGRRIGVGFKYTWFNGDERIHTTWLLDAQGQSSSFCLSVPLALNYLTDVSRDGRVMIGGARAIGTSSYQSFIWQGTPEQPGEVQFVPLPPGATSATVQHVSGDGRYVFGIVRIAAGQVFARWPVTPTGVGDAELFQQPSNYTLPVVNAVSYDGSMFCGATGGNSPTELWVWRETRGLERLRASLPTFGMSLTPWPVIYITSTSYDGYTIGGYGQVNGRSQGLIIELPRCGTSDYNCDGDYGTDADIEAFFACLGGNCSQTCFPGGSDFDRDGDSGTDADIETFFRVLAGGAC